MKNYSPKEFLKKRRPDSFSDSEVVETPVLDRSMFEYFLDTLTSRSEELPFENFARELLKREICPNILPHTGPTGGGDSKVDAETYPVADDLSLVWYVGTGREAANERWAFAFSAKENWRAKVQSDIAKIAKTNRGYTKAFFVTNQFVKDKTRAEVEDALRQKHGIDVRILDRTWILDRVFTNQHEELAITQLNIQVSTRTDVKKGPLDTEREQELHELEASIEESIQQGNFTLQLVDDCIEAAKVARNMERPRAEVEGLLARAERVAQEHGTNHQKLLAAYERAKTAYWYHEDYPSFVAAYPIVERLAQGSVNIYDLELLGNLWMLLRTAVAARALDPQAVGFQEKTALLQSELERMTKETSRPSAALQARTMLLQHRLIDGPKEEQDGILDELREVILQSDGLAGYPLKPYVRIIEELGTIFGERPAYERLFETVVEVITKHDGDIAAARLLLNRGGQQLAAGRNYEAIRTLGRALSRLYKYESRDELMRALYLIGIAYEHVGLLWAARGTTLTAAALATDKFYAHSELTQMQATGYSRMKWLELQLGRLPQILTWHELDLVARAAMNDLPEEPDDNDVNFNAILGMLLLRTTIAQLEHLTTLPAVLDAMRLPMAAVALLYGLGHDNEVPEELSGDTPLTFFQQWLDQPAAKSIPPQPELYEGQTATLTSNIAGCRFVVETGTGTPCVEIAESLLAAIESLVSTAMTEGAIAREPEVTIQVRLGDPGAELVSFSASEREGRVHMDVQCAPFHPHKMTLDEQQKVRSRISDLLLELFARAFVINEIETTLTKLFRDEQAIDRSVNFTSSLIVTGNILGDNPPTTLAPWKTRSGTEYALRRETPWFSAISTQPAASSATEAPSLKVGTGEPPPELEDRERLRHTDFQNVSLIRLNLWDRAGWFATAFAIRPKSPAPPVLAIVFKNRQAAEAIFTALRKDVGIIDEKERLRISILRGVSKEDPYAYTVVVGTNIPTGELSPDKLVIMVSRFHTMHPSSDTNLSGFLSEYARVGAYYLMPAVSENGEPPALLHDYYVGKQELNVREAWQVGRHDPDAPAIREDTDPIIPEGRESDAPVMELLKARRRKS